MAYNAINNTVFAYKAVGDGSTVAQLNDNIEDTRARVGTLETTVSGLDFSLTKLMYRKAFDFSVDVTKSVTGTYSTVDLDQTITNEVLTPAAANDFTAITNDNLDYSSFRFGDKVTIKFDYGYTPTADVDFKIAGVEVLNAGSGGGQSVEIITKVNELAELSERILECKASNTGTLTIENMSISINVG